MTCPFRIANRAKREAQQMDANGDNEDTSEDESDDEDTSEDENIPCYSCGADKDTPCDEMTCPFRIANREAKQRLENQVTDEVMI